MVKDSGERRTLKGFIVNEDDYKKINRGYRELFFMFLCILAFLISSAIFFGIKELLVGEYKAYYKTVLIPIGTLFIGMYFGFKIRCISDE